MNWDEYFTQLSKVVASKSKCLSRQIGAVIVKGHYPISIGYNGPPVGYPHCQGECPRKSRGLASGEGLEFCPAAHAKRNAICGAARLGHSVEGCTMYMYCGVPCRECAKDIINSGISELVLISPLVYPEPGLTGKVLLECCGVSMRVINIPESSYSYRTDGNVEQI